MTATIFSTLTRIRHCSGRKTVILIFLLCLPVSGFTADLPDSATGLYFPSFSLYGRNFEGMVYYMQSAGLNLAVLHAKDPLGRLFWRSKNEIAKNMAASLSYTPLEKAIPFLKKNGIWTAAKLDVFQDSLLTKHHPEMGAMDQVTGELWADRKGLHWANPYDQRVWDYTIELCLELIALGVDEIQFDYIRFPSDGDLSTIEYPVTLPDTSPAECIGRFLAYANSKLKPSGVILSVDLFGLTAWKTDDFGVGQVLEFIAPHVDVICPMLYPSHFPENFLGLQDPEQYPYKIMKSSLEEMSKRTDKAIRPWIQGFWYTPEEIDAQLQGVADCRVQSWTVWHPSEKYADTFRALEERSGMTFPDPEFYPSLDDLRDQADLVLQGRMKIVNQTSYHGGYSIISLDESVEGIINEFDTIMEVVSSLDESVMDKILSQRGFSLSRWTNYTTKATHVAQLVIQDLDLDPRRMRP
ncbi:MAG: hypothetical protein GQ544_07720, partial [Candidatus Aminicenantes bacterium]|nr:hypothetical protein [Candidatus Aminicenantes bacterium]